MALKVFVAGSNEEVHPNGRVKDARGLTSLLEGVADPGFLYVWYSQSVRCLPASDYGLETREVAE